MSDTMHPSTLRPYAARPIRPLLPFEQRGYTLKRYWIDLQSAATPDPADWSEAIELAVEALPPIEAAAHAGLGFMILHRGRGADYLVLAWWARENELPLRVIVRYPDTDDAKWRPARGEESVCVWDLQVIAHERDAYVATLMSGSEASEMRRCYLGTLIEA